MTFANKQAKAVSLKEIAHSAGVSEATVSRVLNGKGELSEKTRQRVLAVAQQFNRLDNRLVRGFQTGRTQMIGALIRPDTDYAGPIFSGIHDTLMQHDCAPLVLYPDVRQGLTEQHQLQRMLEYRVDAILLMPSMFQADDSYFKDAWDRGLPITCIDGWMCKTHTDLATFDNKQGGKLAAEYLLAKGHRQIGHLGGPDYHPVAIDRRIGFEQALSKAGITCAYLSNSGFSHQPQQTEAFLRSHPELTAVFAANDYIAAGTYEACRKLGKRVGEDLSIIGFADLPLAARLQPALTTIRQDGYALGCQATQLMFKRLNGQASPDKPESMFLPVQLIQRESVKAI